MEPALDDPIDRRVRAARPPQADVDPAACDVDLLARLHALEGRPSRGRRLALAASAVLAAAVAAAVVLAGGSPGGVGSARAEMARTLRWFQPPPGTILHTRSAMTTPSGTSVQEEWQSVDHPESERRIEGAAETAPGELYDRVRDTIYLEVAPSRAAQKAAIRRAIAAKLRSARSGADADRLRADEQRLLDGVDRGRQPGARAQESVQAGDVVVAQVRKLLDEGNASVGEQTTHDGTAAIPITARPDSAVARWTLWTAAGDGRPLELDVDRGPVRLGAAERTRWTVYEIVPDDDAEGLLTLVGAHPDARVVRDADAYAAAERRLFPRG
jgi:hypothetical protein